MFMNQCEKITSVSQTICHVFSRFRLFDNKHNITKVYVTITYNVVRFLKKCSMKWWKKHLPNVQYTWSGLGYKPGTFLTRLTQKLQFYCFTKNEHNRKKFFKYFSEICFFFKKIFNYLLLFVLCLFVKN